MKDYTGLMKPCRKCGDCDPELTNGPDGHYVACTTGTGCDGRGPPRMTEDDAVDRWNDGYATVENYRRGTCRNTEGALSHTYAMMSDGNLWPMCGYGWNRSDGERFSIIRDAPGTHGRCKICTRNVDDGRHPTLDGFPHKTKWL